MGHLRMCVHNHTHRENTLTVIVIPLPLQTLCNRNWHPARSLMCYAFISDFFFQTQCSNIIDSSSIALWGASWPASRVAWLDTWAFSDSMLMDCYICTNSFLVPRNARKHPGALILSCQSHPGHWRSTIVFQDHASPRAVIWPQNKEPLSLPLLTSCYHMVGKMDHRGSINVCMEGSQLFIATLSASGKQAMEPPPTH